MGLEGPFASCFIAGSLAFTRYDTDLSTLLFVYVRDCVVKVKDWIMKNLIIFKKGEQGEVPKKVCMDNAVELKSRALSFGLEVNILNFSSKILKQNRERIWIILIKRFMILLLT